LLYYHLTHVKAKRNINYPHPDLPPKEKEKINLLPLVGNRKGGKAKL